MSRRQTTPSLNRLELRWPKPSSYFARWRRLTGGSRTQTFTKRSKSSYTVSLRINSPTCPSARCKKAKTQAKPCMTPSLKSPDRNQWNTHDSTTAKSQRRKFSKMSASKLFSSSMATSITPTLMQWAGMRIHSWWTQSERTHSQSKTRQCRPLSSRRVNCCIEPPQIVLHWSYNSIHRWKMSIRVWEEHPSIPINYYLNWSKMTCERDQHHHSHPRKSKRRSSQSQSLTWLIRCLE